MAEAQDPLLATSLAEGPKIPSTTAPSTCGIVLHAVTLRMWELTVKVLNVCAAVN